MGSNGADRWIEVSPSQFSHEAEGLELVRRILPDETPFRAWSNFEFRDGQGRWHEVDLLLLGRGRLHLIELKYYRGVLRGDDHRWHRDGKRAEDSPLKLARRKAQYLASKLTDELHTWAREQKANIPDPREIIPFVQESVFLHHPDLRCALSDSSKIGLYGLDDKTETSNLPGISERVLEASHRKAIGSNQELILVQLLARIGLVQRRERRAGAWILEEGALAEGDGWQEWSASHSVAHEERATIRFQVTPPGAPQDELQRVHRLAAHEFRTMSRLQHDGLLRPRDLVESDLGVGLVYDADPSWQRLDLWLADRPDGVPLATQLAIVRQLGEALHYAHGNKVVHRALSPHAVWVQDVPGTNGEVKVRVGDWQGAGTLDSTRTTQRGGAGVTSLFGTTRSQPGSTTEHDEGWHREAFTAPEGAWTERADRVRIDIFGLGAVAYYIFTGQAPATDHAALRARLREQGGLDLTVELPQASTALRNLVLQATNPVPASRPADMAVLLSLLSQVERESSLDEDDNQDPLEAVPGAVLDGRFRLERRLGRGSTAVGLLVTDLHGPDDTDLVLKVALHDDAASRLDDEAQILRGLKSPRIVKLIDGPLAVGGRQALLLESAGPKTLSEELRERARLSLDLLERYGTDLLEALVVLDKAGVDHRDIKPSNLGVREDRSKRTKHLVLFDFSLTRAPASATSAGTPPYLDPFLTGTRDRYDSAAERYAAAVVLFEMASGKTPVYGTGDADPATIADEASVEPSDFDPALAQPLTDFFRTALARDAKRRHQTADEMRRQWQSIFTATDSGAPDEDADALAERATLTTPLTESGLTARALSALEPHAVTTVGDLLALDPVRISRMQGVANATRLQITRRMKAWRTRLGVIPSPADRYDTHRSVAGAAELLLSTVADHRSTKLGEVVRVLYGMGADVDAFATNAQLSEALTERVTPARISQILSQLQHLWASDDAAREVLDRVARAVETWLVSVGGVATRDEAVTALYSILDDPEEHRDDRVAAGLLRIAVERLRELARAEEDVVQLTTRRRDGVLTLMAAQPELLDIAELAGREADNIIDAAGDPLTTITPAARVSGRLMRVIGTDGLPDALQGQRLVDLAAAASKHASVTAAGDLHHRDLGFATALQTTFRGFGSVQGIGPQEVRDRVRVRFPGLPQLPQRPRLDQIVMEAGLGWRFDEGTRTYRNTQGSGETTGLESRPATSHAVATSPVAQHGDISRRLTQSLRTRSFLALGIPAVKLTKAAPALVEAYGADVVDVTGVLLQALRSESERANLPWDLVLSADAEAPSSRGAQGLSALVARSWPTVIETIEGTMTKGGEGPVILTDSSPLARYDAMGLLARWTDLSAGRARALWLVAPQLGGNQGSSLDGRPIPLATPSQFLRLDADWIDSLAGMSLASSPKES